MSLIQRKNLPHIAVVVLLLAVLGLYFETWRSMAAVWMSSRTFAHGTLILPMSVYLTWRMRSTWIRIPPRPSLVGLIFLVLSVMAWKMADIAAVQIVSHFAVVAMLVTAIWSIYGFKIVKVLHFPLLYAFFAVPFGEFLIPPLMDWTASFTVSALQIIGIPVLREGNFISLPSGNFRVIEACSGVRFLIVTVVLGLFFAHEAFASQRKRLLFILAAAAAIIIANGVRAFIVVIVAHLSEMRFGSGQEHIYLGWVVFLLTISIVFWVGRRYSDAEALWGGRAANEKESTESQFTGATPKFVLVLSISLATLALGPQLSIANGSSAGHSYPPSQLPSAIADWSGPGKPEIPYRPEFVGQTKNLAGRYENDGQPIELHVIFYSHQEQGAELIGFRNRLFDPDVWRSVLGSSGGDGGASRMAGLPVSSVTITDNRRLLRLWYWYDVGGHVVSSPYMAKVMQMWSALTGNVKSAAVIVLATPISDLTDDAELPGAFLKNHLDALHYCLRPQSAEEHICASSLR